MGWGACRAAPAPAAACRDGGRCLVGAAGPCELHRVGVESVCSEGPGAVCASCVLVSSPPTARDVVRPHLQNAGDSPGPSGQGGRRRRRRYTCPCCKKMGGSCCCPASLPNVHGSLTLKDRAPASREVFKRSHLSLCTHHSLCSCLAPAPIRCPQRSRTVIQAPAASLEQPPRLTPVFVARALAPQRQTQPATTQRAPAKPVTRAAAPQQNHSYTPSPPPPPPAPADRRLLTRRL